MSRWGLLWLRLAVGAVFAAHGLAKLIPIWGRSPATTVALFESVGLTPAYPITLAAGGVELLCGVVLIAGAYTPWVTLVLAAYTAVTVWKIHLAHGFFLNWTLEPGGGHGYEYHLLLIAALVCLLFGGPGAASVDAGRAHSAEAAAARRARLRAGSVE